MVAPTNLCRVLSALVRRAYPAAGLQEWQVVFHLASSPARRHWFPPDPVSGRGVRAVSSLIRSCAAGRQWLLRGAGELHGSVLRGVLFGMHTSLFGQGGGFNFHNHHHDFGVRCWGSRPHQLAVHRSGIIPAAQPCVASGPWITWSWLSPSGVGRSLRTCTTLSRSAVKVKRSSSFRRAFPLFSKPLTSLDIHGG